MLNIFGNIFLFTSFFFIFLYTCLYLLRDFYFISNNLSVNKLINLIIPFFTTNNLMFFYFAFSFLVLYLIISYISSPVFHSGYLLVLFMLFLIKLFLESPQNNKYSNILNLFSYFLFIGFLFHIIFEK